MCHLEGRERWAMNLKEALLCIDCEWLYAQCSHCPRCGSHVSYPLARAIDGRQSVLPHLVKPRPRPTLVRPLRETEGLHAASL